MIATKAPPFVCYYIISSHNQLDLSLTYYKTCCMPLALKLLENSLSSSWFKCNDRGIVYPLFVQRIQLGKSDQEKIQSKPTTMTNKGGEKILNHMTSMYLISTGTNQ